jgi:hypothetical protein
LNQLLILVFYFPLLVQTSWKFFEISTEKSRTACPLIV